MKFQAGSLVVAANYPTCDNKKKNGVTVVVLRYLADDILTVPCLRDDELGELFSEGLGFNGCFVCEGDTQPDLVCDYLQLQSLQRWCFSEDCKTGYSLKPKSLEFLIQRVVFRLLKPCREFDNMICCPFAVWKQESTTKSDVFRPARTLIPVAQSKKGEGGVMLLVGIDDGSVLSPDCQFLVTHVEGRLSKRCQFHRQTPQKASFDYQTQSCSYTIDSVSQQRISEGRRRV